MINYSMKSSKIAKKTILIKQLMFIQNANAAKCTLLPYTLKFLYLFYIF